VTRAFRCAAKIVATVSVASNVAANSKRAKGAQSSALQFFLVNATGAAELKT